MREAVLHVGLAECDIGGEQAFIPLPRDQHRGRRGLRHHQPVVAQAFMEEPGSRRREHAIGPDRQGLHRKEIRRTRRGSQPQLLLFAERAERVHAQTGLSKAP
jgi:hypothetical protein